MDRSIKRTLTLHLFGLIIIVNLLVGVSFYLFLKVQSEREFNNTIELQVQHLSDALIQQIWLFDLDSVERLANLAIDYPEIVYIQVSDHNGNVLVDKSVAGKTPEVRFDRQLIHGGETPVGSLQIGFIDNSAQAHRLNLLIPELITLAVTIITTLLLINFILRKHLVKPLTDLQQEMGAIARGKFKASNLQGYKSEIQDIINDFNEMATALAKREREQRETEARLVNSQERFLSLFLGSRDSIFTLDLNWRLVDINPAMLTLLGYSREEIKTVKGNEIFVLPEHHPSPFDIIERQGAISEFEIELLTSSGSKKTGLLSGTLWTNNEGNILGYHGILRDITEQRKLEAQLRQSQKIEAIGTLAGGIAHDFNNILSAIYGYTQLAQMADENPERLKKCLDGIFQATNRAQYLVKQILTFSRQGTQEKRPLYLSTLSKEVVRLLRQTVPATIDIIYEATSESTITADPTQVHQVLMNLCTNAYQAMRTTGGTMRISVVDIDLQQAELTGKTVIPAGRYALVVVSDTGSGMDAETVDKIYEPYFTTKPMGEGTGLGLSVVHGIVTDHQGSIVVESEPGVGTTFRVYLPVTPEQPVDTGLHETLQQPQTGLQGSERVLFVDDEENLVTIADKVFSKYGYSIITSQNPDEALKIFAAAPDRFDLLVTDMTMPQMTGMELAREIFARRPDLPVFLCTGYSELISEKEAKAQGVAEFVMKPYPMKKLLEIIRKHCGATAP